MLAFVSSGSGTGTRIYEVAARIGRGTGLCMRAPQDFGGEKVGTAGVAARASVYRYRYRYRYRYILVRVRVRCVSIHMERQGALATNLH